MNSLLTESTRSYRAALKSNITLMMRGAISVTSFIANVQTSMNDEFRLAWIRGAAVCGIKEADFTPEERAALSMRVAQETVYVMHLGYELLELGFVKPPVKPSSFWPRVETWVNTLIGVENQATLMACANQKLMWIYGPTEHCADCASYNGRVYRASTWQRYGIIPQSHSLACGGWRCQCRFEVTDLPLTPGRPPGMKG